MGACTSEKKNQNQKVLKPKKTEVKTVNNVKEENNKCQDLSKDKTPNLSLINQNTNQVPAEVPTKSREKEESLISEDKKKEPKYYLVCPCCKNHSPRIKKFYFDSKKKEYIGSFQCKCIEGDRKTAKLYDFISEVPPRQDCFLHYTEKIEYYCQTCKYYICGLCLEGSHSNHSILKNGELYQKYIKKYSFDLDKAINTLEKKRKTFEIEYHESKNYLSNKLEEIIKRINKIKEESLKCLDDFYEQNEKIFLMIKNEFESYNRTSIEDNTPFIFNNMLKLNMDEESEEDGKEKMLFSNIDFFVSSLPKEEVLELKCGYNFFKKPSKNFTCIETLEGHKDKVIAAIELEDGRLATGSYDQTIKIWNLITMVAELTLKEEGSIFTLVEIKPEILLSGGSGNVINCWNLSKNTNAPEYTFVGHQLWVNCIVKISPGLFASCSNDATIQIWDFDKGPESIKTICGHTDCVLTMILLNDGRLCSGGADNSIRFWNWEREKCELILNGHEKWVKCLCQISDKYIASGSDDKTIRIWEKGKCIKILREHNNSVRCICYFSSKYFISGSFDMSIKVWKIETFTCVKSLNQHSQSIISLTRLKNGDLVSTSNDKTIKIWR